jgi:hypothetical protein
MTKSIPQQWVNVWCGRISFLMHRTRVSLVDAIAFDLRLEWVAVCVEEQVLAVIDRDRLRLWLAEPAQPLVVDHVVLAGTDGRLLLFVGHDWCVDVPTDITHALRERV